jgi:hypothetical protein
MSSYFDSIEKPDSIITAIPAGELFPDLIVNRSEKYLPHVDTYKKLVLKSNSSGELLEKIRTPGKFTADIRMSLLKLFRRTVSLVCDTEATKKITVIKTSSFVENYGHTFKPIDKLKKQFKSMSDKDFVTLCVLLGEYDSRGQQGYMLTNIFFNWFETTFVDMDIEGPRGAGKDIELSSVFPKFKGHYPCDFVIKGEGGKVLAVGFARYDSTRGGSQSDDRTGGNSNKVSKAIEFERESSNNFKLIFLSDGPGLIHKDTWRESCILDGQWNGNVRVSTLKTASDRITKDWLLS